MRVRAITVVVAVLLAAVWAAAPAAAATKTWTGVNSNDWAQPLNWTFGATPAAGDDVVFPRDAGRLTSRNDTTPGTAYRSLTIRDGYAIDGNLLGLQAGLVVETINPRFQAVLDTPIDLLASQSFGGSGSTRLGGSVALGGHTLTLSGGTYEFRGGVIGPGQMLVPTGGASYVPGGATVAVPTTVDGGSLQVGGWHPQPVHVRSGAFAGGGGRTGPLRVDAGQFNLSGIGGLGLTVEGDLRVTGPTVFVVAIDGPTAVTQYSQAKVTGNVTVGGSLFLNVRHEAAPGTVFTIVDNDGTDAVQGEFRALPEGRHVIHQRVEYEVSYRGGDGNDVTLRAVRTNAVPSVRIDDVTVTEGPGRQADFRVTLDPVAYGNPTVQATPASGTARNPEDFTQGPRRIVFPELESTVLFSLPIRDDFEVEGTEVGYVRLSAPEGAVIADGEGVLTILDDESQPAGGGGGGGGGGAGGPGYWMVANDGGMFTFGSAAFHGSAAGSGAVVAGMAPTPSRGGYWLAAANGRTFAYGDAGQLPGAQVTGVARPVVGVATRSGGNGFWRVATDGGVFTAGDAAFHGSMGGKPLNQPIVGMASTPTGGGYWLVASDGGIFTFGDAAFTGSTGDLRLNSPIVGMAATPSGAGYWLVAADGGIFTFGDAAFLGSTGAMVLNKPIVGMAPTAGGSGYWLVASDGGIFTFGDAPFLGSTGDIRLNRPIVGIGV